MRSPLSFPYFDPDWSCLRSNVFFHDWYIACSDASLVQNSNSFCTVNNNRLLFYYCNLFSIKCSICSTSHQNKFVLWLNVLFILFHQNELLDSFLSCPDEPTTELLVLFRYIDLWHLLFISPRWLSVLLTLIKCSICLIK